MELGNLTTRMKVWHFGKWDKKKSAKTAGGADSHWKKELKILFKELIEEIQLLTAAAGGIQKLEQKKKGDKN